MYHLSRFHIYGLIYDFVFLSDLTSVCIIGSGSSLVSPNDPISFPYMAE